MLFLSSNTSSERNWTHFWRILIQITASKYLILIITSSDSIHKQLYLQKYSIKRQSDLMDRCIIERQNKYISHLFKLDLPVRRYDIPNTGMDDCCVVFVFMSREWKIRDVLFSQRHWRVVHVYQRSVTTLGWKNYCKHSKTAWVMPVQSWLSSRTCKGTFLEAGGQELS
jgi:hypothetical protein